MEWEIVSLVPRRERQRSKCKEDPWLLLKWMGLWEAVNERDGGSPLMALWVSRGVVRAMVSGLYGEVSESSGEGGHTQWTLNQVNSFNYNCINFRREQFNVPRVTPIRVCSK